jgi:hypothetical protein
MLNNQDKTYKLNTEENNKIKQNTIKIKTKNIMEFNKDQPDQPIRVKDKTQHNNNNNKLELLLLNSPHKI